jgi:hypothetical protein
MRAVPSGKRCLALSIASKQRPIGSKLCAANKNIELSEEEEPQRLKRIGLTS